jgi:hypothetical protein
MSVLRVPTWGKIWLISSALICAWDCAFVLLRPRTLPGGDLHTPWFSPYATYIEVDRSYQDMENAFVQAQSW